MPQALIVVLGAIGAAIAARFIAREWRRINEELERARASAPVDAREGIPVLHRDPKTGVYRPTR
jgi:hypothetical protein